MQRTAEPQEPPLLDEQDFDCFESPGPLKALRTTSGDGKEVHTPHSQASTAPPTPFQSWSLPECHLDGIRFQRLYSNDSSMVADEVEYDVPLHSDLGQWAAEEVECDVPLHSDLGQWAARVVAQEDQVAEASTEDSASEGMYQSSDDILDEIMIDDPEHITCIGMPPLQSELGKWAQRVVEAEEWLEGKLSAEFTVDNTNLRALTVGIAYRMSKHINHRDRASEGPHWGDTVVGVDQGDGWVKVGRRYLPKTLDGKPVLIPRSAQGDHLVRVPSAPKVFKVDLDGVVHGAPWKSGRFPGRPTDRASELRHFHERKQLRRKCEGTVSWCEGFALAAANGGQVSAVLYLESGAERADRRRRRLAAVAAAQQKEVPGCVFSVDAGGVVQEWLSPGEAL